jgi:hypothetical protein
METLKALKQQAESDDAYRARMMDRALDFEYVKMTVIVVILIVLVFYMTCRFGFGLQKVSPPSSGASDQSGGGGNQGAPSSSTSAQPPSSEKFSPYESTLVHDMHRDDPSGDVPSANPLGRSSEYFLFNQMNGWAVAPITPKPMPSVDPSKYQNSPNM